MDSDSAFVPDHVVEIIQTEAVLVWETFMNSLVASTIHPPV